MDREKQAFIKRLETAARRVGSLYALAKAARISDDALYHYRSRGDDPTRAVLIKIAVAAGVSVEWLATGKEPIAWDAHRLREVVESVETWLKLKRRTMSAPKKAELIAAIYEEIAEQERAQAAEPAEPRPARIIQLVEKRAA